MCLLSDFKSFPLFLQSGVIHNALSSASTPISSSLHPKSRWTQAVIHRYIRIVNHHLRLDPPQGREKVNFVSQGLTLSLLCTVYQSSPSVFLLCPFLVFCNSAGNPACWSPAVLPVHSANSFVVHFYNFYLLLSGCGSGVRVVVFWLEGHRFNLILSCSNCRSVLGPDTETCNLKIARSHWE